MSEEQNPTEVAAAAAGVVRGLRVVSDDEERAGEDARQRAALERARRDFIPWLARCGVPRRYHAPIEKTALDPRLLAWAEGFPASLGTGAGVLLCGPTGTGKTTQAAALVRAAYHRGRLEDDGSWRAPSALFVHAVDLSEWVFDKQADKIKLARAVDLLVIDDWGVAYESEWPLSVLDRVVDARWAELRSTIVTTNLFPLRNAEAGIDAQTFEGRYPRAFSRLADAAGPGVVMLEGGDRRREVKP